MQERAEDGTAQAIRWGREHCKAELGPEAELPPAQATEGLTAPDTPPPPTWPLSGLWDLMAGPAHHWGGLQSERFLKSPQCLLRVTLGSFQNPDQ